MKGQCKEALSRHPEEEHPGSLEEHRRACLAKLNTAERSRKMRMKRCWLEAASGRAWVTLARVVSAEGQRWETTVVVEVSGGRGMKGERGTVSGGKTF